MCTLVWRSSAGPEPSSEDPPQRRPGGQAPRGQQHLLSPAPRSLPEGSAACAVCSGNWTTWPSHADSEVAAAHRRRIHADRDQPLRGFLPAETPAEIIRPPGRNLRARRPTPTWCTDMLDAGHDRGTGMTGRPRSWRSGPGSGVILSRLSEIFDEAVTGVDSSRTPCWTPPGTRSRVGARDNVRLEARGLPWRCPTSGATTPSSPPWSSIIRRRPPPSFARRPNVCSTQKARALVIVAELCHHDQEWARRGLRRPVAWLRARASWKPGRTAGRIRRRLNHNTWPRKTGSSLQIHRFHYAQRTI